MTVPAAGCLSSSVFSLQSFILSQYYSTLYYCTVEGTVVESIMSPASILFEKASNCKNTLQELIVMAHGPNII